MEQVNIMEAARRCGVSDKTIRRAIKDGKLPVDRPKSNVALINVADLEAWHELTTDAIERRLAVLEQRVHTLEFELERTREYERQLRHHLGDHDNQIRQLFGETGILQHQREAVELKAARKTKPKSNPLPDSLVSLYTFIDQHAVPSGEVRQLIKAGHIHIVTGKWMTEKGRIEEALDQAGQREFWVQLHSRDDFRTCDDCPHIA